MTGVVSNLLRELAAQEFKSATAFVAPFLRGAGLVLVIAIVVVVAILAAALTVLPPGVSQQVTAGGVLALGTGILGSVAALVTRQSSPQPAGAGAADLEPRLARLEKHIEEGLATGIESTFQPILPQHFSWQGVVQSVATDVVNQLRLEEIYLGVSEPLVRYVLAPEASKGGKVASDPSAAARRFMELIYESTPNIDRLGTVFLDIYRAAGIEGQLIKNSD
jgi:hypothetical protein